MLAEFELAGPALAVAERGESTMPADAADADDDDADESCAESPSLLICPVAQPPAARGGAGRRVAMASETSEAGGRHTDKYTQARRQ